MNTQVIPLEHPISCPPAKPPVINVLPPHSPPSAVLRAARDLISEPDRWTKWGFRFKTKPETEEEAEYDPGCTYSEATCFCSLGAINAVTSAWMAQNDIAKVLLRSAIRDTTGFKGIPSFNDAPETTHADVLRMFNRAIVIAEDREEIAALQTAAASLH